MHISIYACKTSDFASQGDKFVAGDILPSPVGIKRSDEQIWSENTGRAQSGTNKALMIGESVAKKKTLNVSWGVLTSSEMTDIRNKLKSGFFVFGWGTSLNNASDNAITAYRGEISSEMLSLNGIYYKNASVSIIER